MPEALTESFCERCGTRYEFAAPTELNTIRKTRGLISGLKNYIMSQDALSDAVGDAMRTEEEALASQQLDAFHDQFNFCINCRQYTCTNCWNGDAGRCRTCAPIAGTDDLLERFEATFQAQHPELTVEAAALEQAELNRRLGLEAWPTEDVGVAPAATNGAGAVTEWPAEEQLTETEPEPVSEPMAAEAEPVVAPEPAITEPMAAEAEPVVAPEPAAQFGLIVVEEVAEVAEPAPPVAAAEEFPPLRVLTWEDDAAFQLEPEPVVAEFAETEPEPEPVVAEVAPEPEPEPEPIRPISETIIQIPRQVIEPVAPAEERVAAQADDPLMAARRAQLDLLGLGDPGDGPLAAERNVLPYRSTGASVHPIELAQRTAAGLPEPGAFWEASAREVAGAMSHVGVQACGECGLSLSASARFCRRCGTRQAQSA
ncbi:MAG TPA: hypothetical protein VF153_00635 [Candidatus Limnocylindria bacterium]